MSQFKKVETRSDENKWNRIIALENELTDLYGQVLDDDNSHRDDTTTYDTLFERFTDVIIFCNLDLTIQTWNDAAIATYGYTREEAIGRTTRDLLQSKPLKSDWDVAHAELRKKGYWKGELSYRHKDGHEIITEVATNYIYDGDEPVGIIAIQRDITSRHLYEQLLEQRVRERTEQLEKANQQLEKDQKLYEALIKNFPNGIVGIVNHDLNFEIMGGEGVIHLPYASDDLVGRKLSDFMPDEIAKRDEPYLIDALAGTSAVQQIEYEGRYYQTHTLPIKDKDKILAAMVTTQDITELLKAQENLRHNEEKYRILFHSIPDMVFILNDRMEFVLVNQSLANFLDMTPDSIQGQTLDELFVDFDDAIFRRNYRLSIEDKHPRVVIGQHTTNQRWYESRIIPVQEGLLIINRDVTRQRQMNLAALESEVQRIRSHTRDEIVHNLAHDLRTPLSTIQTSLYLLEHYTDPEKQQKKLNDLKRQVEQLEQMIENILLLTELDTYRSQDLKKTNINSLVKDVIESFKTLATDHQIQFECDLPEDIIFHRVHMSHLTVALSHVIKNAIIYSNPESTVYVTLQRDASHKIMITVEDEGIGIEPENLPLIFDRFFRANTARTINDAGNGLGLTIVQEIIELHHGSIDVTSVLHEGTKVTIIL